VSSSRAVVSNQGTIGKKADAAYAALRLVVEGSDADHVKYPSAVTQIPVGVLVDGCEAAEDAVSVALLGRGETKVIKLNGTCNKGDWLCAEDPATDATGKARAVPATNGAYWVIGRAMEAGVDEQEIAVDDCFPFLAGSQDDGQLSLPSFAGDPATPVPGQIWYNSADNALKAYINGAARTIATLSVAIAFALACFLGGSPASAGDKTPVVVSNSATGLLAAAVLADNVKVPGTLEVTGTTVLTGAVTTTAGFADLGTITTIDINGGTVDGVTIGGAAAGAGSFTTLGATGAVTIVEGALTDSMIVTADIKDGEIVDADVNASAAIAHTKLGLPAVRTLSESVAFGSFTDGGGTSGYIDLGSNIPAQCIVLGWKANVTTGFTGDTTAVVMVGKSGDTDCFSADTAQSALGVAKVGSNALAAASYTAAATTPRVTVTGGADFTSISAGVMVVTIYYMQTE